MDQAGSTPTPPPSGPTSQNLGNNNRQGVSIHVLCFPQRHSVDHGETPKTGGAHTTQRLTTGKAVATNTYTSNVLRHAGGAATLKSEATAICWIWKGTTLCSLNHGKLHTLHQRQNSSTTTNNGTPTILSDTNPTDSQPSMCRHRLCRTLVSQIRAEHQTAKNYPDNPGTCW